jgi:hypothetical protein
MPARKDLSDTTIRTALDASGGMVSAAAHMLGVSPTTLYRRLKEDPNLRHTEKELMDFEVRKALLRAGIGGNVRAIIYWEREFVGWGRPKLPELRRLDRAHREGHMPDD